MNNIPLYDVTGTCYAPGVSNFTLYNVYAALRSVGITERRTGLTARVHIHVYDNLATSGQLDYFDDLEIIKWCGITIQVDENSDCRSSCVDSIITDSRGKSVCIRTRESP